MQPVCAVEQDVLRLIYIVLSEIIHVPNHIAMRKNLLEQIIGIAMKMKATVVVSVVMVVLCQLLLVQAFGTVTKVLVF